MKRSRKRKAPRERLLLLTPLVVLGAGALLYSALPSSPSAESARAVIYPTLYSDSNITRAAIDADPRFAQEKPLAHDTLRANVFDAFLEPEQEPPHVQKDTAPEKGTWLWTPLLQITPAYRDSVLLGAQKNGIRNIYLSLDSYLDIYTLQDGPEKNAQKAIFDRRLESFITRAAALGMTVDAEGGWRNWAEEGHEYKAFALLAYAQEFNATHEAKLRGFQFDVEPYMLDSYKTDKASVLRRFVALIDESVAQMRESDLQLSVTIPEFYDGNGETPGFFYGFRYGYTIDHLLRVLQRRPESKIIVMAYRNFAEGQDGAIEIAQDEVHAANEYGTKVIVAQETGDVPPSYITFHNTSRTLLRSQVAIIDSAFAADASYGGTAVHYVNALLSLK